MKLLVALALLLLPAAALAAPCDAPGHELRITEPFLFQHGGNDTWIIPLLLSYQPGPAYATAIDEDGVQRAWMAASVMWPEREGRGVRLIVALKSLRTGEPGYAEMLRAVVCVRRW